MGLTGTDLGGSRSNQTVRATLRQIAVDSPRLEEELLAERIERAADSWLQGEWTPTLSEMIGAVPLLRSRPLALDAAIDAVLRCLLAQGLTLEEGAARLRVDAPEFAEAIGAHMALRSLMNTSRADHRPASAGYDALPAPFGPALEGGRQRYELVECVGRGSEGRVFRAFDRFLSADGRPLQVAVKLLHATGREMARRVSEEAARATRVRHPAIAALLNCGDAEGRPFLVYEFVEGLPLDRWRRNQGAVTPQRAAGLVRRLAEGVQVAHNAGVVHRDLKPNNIIVNERGTPHITDFGLAEAISPDRDGAPAGSLAFAAPEQMRGDQGGADAAVDVYALGGILFWLLTGKYPNGDTNEEAKARVSASGPARDHDLRRVPGRERTLRRISAKALQTHPGDRYSSAGLLATDLDRWLAHEPVLPFDNATPRRLALAVRRSPVTAAVVAMAAMSLVVVLGYGWKIDADQRQARFELERDRLEQQVAATQTRAEEQQRRIDNAGALVSGFVRVLETMRAGSPDTAWLPVLTAVEALGGRDMLAVSDSGGDLIQSRIDVVARLLDEAEGAGIRDTVEMTMWETALGYWLLSAGQFERGRLVLDVNRERVGRVFPADDPWALIATALREVAVVRTEPGSDAAAAASAWLQANGDGLPPAVREFAGALLAGEGAPGL